MTNGKILSFSLHANLDDINGKDVIVLDDCITNGGTFLGLLGKIVEFSPASVSLCVTHADHKEGVLKMVASGGFDHIYISNSRNWVNYLPRDTRGVTVYELTMYDGHS